MFGLAALGGSRWARHSPEMLNQSLGTRDSHWQRHPLLFVPRCYLLPSSPATCASSLPCRAGSLSCPGPEDLTLGCCAATLIHWNPLPWCLISSDFRAMVAAKQSSQGQGPPASIFIVTIFVFDGNDSQILDSQHLHRLRSLS